MTDQSCDGSRIAGASFSVYPMSDDFVVMIQEAINEVNTSKVWMQTDDVTTTVRGKLIHVFDVTWAIYSHIVQTGKHVAFQSTYSLGCPGDSEGDVYLAEDDSPANEGGHKEIKSYITAKFSLYPLGVNNYMGTIYKQVEKMKAHVNVTPVHYATKLSGDGTAVFAGLKDIFRATVEAGSKHTVMTVSASANSPSHQKEIPNE